MGVCGTYADRALTLARNTLTRTLSNTAYDRKGRMKITIAKDATCGKVMIPGGEYMVALATDTQSMTLTGGGKQLKIPAIKRRSSAKTRITTVSFYSGGGTAWNLLVQTPKFGEWIALVEYVKNGADARR